MADPANRTEQEWREILSPEEFAVLRQGATERPFTGEYDGVFREGRYLCRACGTELFTSETKFDAQCGWPAFYAPLAEDRVRYIRDESMGMVRTEVRCATCDGHLGHVFYGEGFPTPTDARFCINSISLELVAD
ncbi:MAG TPA: peptide-methionine (R)-S-oxide reductase MsrB [Brevibacterium ravenspurgense]|nr:peptide-methionine (R)-S-oxide reductase MsrB [Brevibacterium ravenspurgense]